MTGRWVGPVAAAALCGTLLLGCGDDDGGETSSDGGAVSDDTGEAATDDGGGGDGDVYTGELADGSELVIRLDVPADDPAVVPFEEFRELTGADEPTWIVGEITVPDGVDGTGRFVTFVEPGADRLDDDPADDADGVTNSEFACAVLEDWFQAAPAQDEALNDAYLEVYDGPCGGQSHQVLAPGGETTTYVMVYDGDLPDFERLESELGNELEPA